jgi:hypothetical protein
MIDDTGAFSPNELITKTATQMLERAAPLGGGAQADAGAVTRACCLRSLSPFFSLSPTRAGQSHLPFSLSAGAQSPPPAALRGE